MKFYRLLLNFGTVILLSNLFLTDVRAQVVINEFSSSSDPEWVELYNSGASPVDLTDWALTDSAGHTEKLSGVIDPGGYFVYERKEGWLNNSGGDVINLSDPTEDIVDIVEYGIPESELSSTPDSDKSAGRVPDGSANLANDLEWTKGSSNPSPSPSPTPAPTETPVPTFTPTRNPTNTSTSTPTPTLTPTPKPTSTLTPTISLTPAPTEEEGGSGGGNVLSFSETFGGNWISPDPKNLQEIKTADGNKFPWAAGLLIVSGLGLTGYSLYSFLANKKSEYNLSRKYENDN